MTDPFRKVRTPCMWCRRPVQTLAYRDRPMCHGCRAKRRNLLKGRDATRALAALRMAYDSGELR